MKTRLQSLVAVLVGIPGIFKTREQFAEMRSNDQKYKQGSFLDNLGEIIFVDANHVLVIPASELKSASLEQLNELGSRLTRLVATKDGVLCTATGSIPEPWLHTFSKFTPFQDGDTSEHFVKRFSPNYEGPIMGYHVVRTGDRQLNTKVFTSINSRPIVGLDLVQYEGKVNLAAVTQADFRNPKSQVFLREATISALKDKTSIHSQWKPAPWNGDYDVSSLRGTVQNGKVMYAFLNQNTRTLMAASLTDKSAKTLQEGVKGMLDIVSGAQIDSAHMATVITNKEIVAIGDKKNTVIADLSSPAFDELARQIRKGKTLRGIYGKENVYASSVGETQGHLMVTPVKYIETRAS